MIRCIHCEGLISQKELDEAQDAANEADEDFEPPCVCVDCAADIAADERYYRSLWRSATARERDPVKYARDLKESGR
jgi:hypothetical protein